MTHRAYLLTTPRLGLRRLVIEDLEALRPVFADAYAAQFYPAMRKTERLVRWIHWNLQNYTDYGFGLWALERLDTGVFVGDAGITYQTVEGQRVLEIGWHVHPQHRGQGLATEAGRACLDYGFTQLQATTLCSMVDPANVASIQVASRVHARSRPFQGSQGPMHLFSTDAPARVTPSPLISV
ncbi:MAG: GNAT family N-acetyltransferase [Candidatus Saccharibacteria bacterium]|nr:GNAT family N-acetyltransferase [Rhodoferax sp.]